MFFLVFGFFLISSPSVWLHNCLIGSKIEGSIEIEGFVVDFTVNLVDFAGHLGDFKDFEGFKDFIGSVI